MLYSVSNKLDLIYIIKKVIKSAKKIIGSLFIELKIYLINPYL